MLQLNKHIDQLKATNHEQHSAVEQLRNQAISLQDPNVLEEALRLAISLLGANV